MEGSKEKLDEPTARNDVKPVILTTPNMQGLVEKGKLVRAKADKALSLHKGVLDYIEFKDVDLVIEVKPCSVHVMPFLEIVTEKTSPQVIVDLLSVAKTINKVAAVVRNCPGFAVNRTFFPYTTAQSSHLLVHLGVDLFRIDRVITKFGFLVGPFQYVLFLNH
ncbi:hypothetical protein CsatB_010183 [Cannabis sativa]